MVQNKKNKLCLCKMKTTKCGVLTARGGEGKLKVYGIWFIYFETSKNSSRGLIFLVLHHHQKEVIPYYTTRGIFQNFSSKCRQIIKLHS